MVARQESHEGGEHVIPERAQRQASASEKKGAAWSQLRGSSIDSCPPAFLITFVPPFAQGTWTGCEANHTTAGH